MIRLAPNENSNQFCNGPGCEEQGALWQCQAVWSTDIRATSAASGAHVEVAEDKVRNCMNVSCDKCGVWTRFDQEGSEPRWVWWCHQCAQHDPADVVSGTAVPVTRKRSQRKNKRLRKQLATRYLGV